VRIARVKWDKRRRKVRVRIENAVEGPKLAADNTRPRNVDLCVLILPVFLARSQVCCDPEHRVTRGVGIGSIVVQ
jgi:hypothetical protein